MKFLNVEGKLLRNSSLTPADKLIISYIYGLNRSGLTYFGSLEWLALELGINVPYVQKRVERLISVGVLTISGNEIGLGMELDRICSVILGDLN